jgi:hypothetical protein
MPDAGLRAVCLAVRIAVHPSIISNGETRSNAMTYTVVHAAPAAVFLSDYDGITVASFQPPVEGEDHR